MALNPDIAVFRWGKGGSTAYELLLRQWASNREEVTFFSDFPENVEGDIHYLRFPQINRKKKFDLIFYDIDNTVEHAACFHYLGKWPGVLFLNNCSLDIFARATSFSTFDPWGFKWILGSVFGEKAENLARLENAGIDNSSVYEKKPLAYALAIRSAASVVPDLESGTFLSNKPGVSLVSVIEPDAAEEVFSAAMNKLLPVLLKRQKGARATIKPLAHPNADLLKVECERIRQRFGEDYTDLAKIAIDEMTQLFTE